MQQPRGALEFGMIQHLAVLHLVQQGNILERRFALVVALYVQRIGSREVQ